MLVMKNKSYPKEKVGTKYRVIIADYPTTKGDIIILYANDGSSSPFFKIVGSNIKVCTWWSCLSKVEAKRLIGGEVL